MADRPKITVGRFTGPTTLALVDQGWTPIATTRGNPKFRLPYQYRALRLLAPSRDEFTMGDQQRFASSYRARMDGIGVDRISAELARIIGDTPGGVLLCFENLNEGKWCHRSVFAGWWQDRTGVEVPEVDDTPEAPPLRLFD